MVRSKKIQSIKRKVDKSIYLKLVFGVLASVLFSVVVFYIIFFSCKSTKLLTRRFVDYTSSKYEFIDEFQENLIAAKQKSSAQEALQYFANHMQRDSDVYITDKDGNAIYTGKNNKDQSLVTARFDLDALARSNCKLNVGETGEFTYYDILYLEKEIYYVIQTTNLSGSYRYNYSMALLFSFGVAIVLFFINIFLLIRKKMDYIRYLSSSVGEISKGNLDYKVDVRGVDEFAVVANNINEMETNLKTRIDRQNKQNQIYKELVTNMSHDLKTPLTVILGYLDIVRNHQYKSEEQQQEYLDISYNKAVSLQKMILNLFDLVRNEEAGKELSLQKVNLSRLMKQYLLDYEFAAKDHNITVTSHIAQVQLEIPLNLEKMTRVFNNIFENALKYCTENGVIDVNVAEEEATVLIDISNTSQFVEAEELDHIFEKFYRLDKARNSSVEGNGIGLCTVKKIIEAHNGKVWAEYSDDRFHLKVRLRKKM